MKRFPLILLTLVRLGLGLVLLYSGLQKVRQPQDFLSAVYDYELFGPRTGMLVAAIVPWVEVVVGACLLANLYAEGALLAAVLLGASFVFVQGWILYRGLDVSCGCFGSDAQRPASYSTLGLAVLVWAGALTGYLLALKFRSAPARSPRATESTPAAASLDGPSRAALEGAVEAG